MYGTLQRLTVSIETAVRLVDAIRHVGTGFGFDDPDTDLNRAQFGQNKRRRLREPQAR